MALSGFELASLELQQFWRLLKVHAIELHAKFLVGVCAFTHGPRSRAPQPGPASGTQQPEIVSWSPATVSYTHLMSTGLIPDRNTREKAPLTPLSTALSKRSKMLIVVLSSFPRAVRATYGVGGSEAAPSHSLAAVRSGVAPSVGMFPMSKGPRVRIEGPSWQGIPCHDAPVTFGAHVTRVTISVLEQTECGQVVSHFCRSRRP